MKICGILSWYDESPSWLANTVASMGRFCDSIVAVDGAYALYPKARTRSMPEQAEAIIRAAEIHDVAVTVHQPSALFFGNEVEKRNLTLKLAGATLTDGDWVCVVDADQYVMRCNPVAIRRDLERTDKLVARYTVLEGNDMLGDPQIADLARAEDLDTEWTSHVSCMYRWDPTLQYGPLHWSVSLLDGGERKWLWGPQNVIEDSMDLGASLVFYHRQNDRAAVRRAAQVSYYETRDVMKIEQWEAQNDVPVSQ